MSALLQRLAAPGVETSGRSAHATTHAKEFSVSVSIHQESAVDFDALSDDVGSGGTRQESDHLRDLFGGAGAALRDGRD